MNKITIEKLKRIVECGDFEILKNCIENEFFECKKEPYRLDSELAKRELAKDVSSFANSNGGYILIGIRAEKLPTHPFDIVKKISYLSEDRINVRQYYDIIKDWVYPEIHGLSILWVKSSKDQSKGIFVIYIPKQDHSRKPFLITKEVHERKKSEIMFGYAERKSDSSRPKDVRVIYNLIRDGLTYTYNLESRFDRIETLLELYKKKGIQERLNNLEQEITDRIYQTLKVNNMNSKPASMLIAYTSCQKTLKSIFDRTEGSIYRKLERPGNLRYAGWDLETLDTPKIIEGKFIQVCNGDRKTIRLYRDGTLLFAADQGFWFWPKIDEKRLNCLAIIESVYNFVNFYKDVLSDFIPPESSAFFKFGIFNYHQDGKKAFLCAGSLKSISFQFANNPHFAPKNEHVSQAFLFNFSELPVAAIAYELVKEIYLWFGILEEGIPYTKIEDGRKIIDIEKIISQK